MGIEIFPVTKDIWCARRRSYLTCFYGVRSANGIVLVDAGMNSRGTDAFELVSRAFGSKPEDIRAVLLTHWHNDHAAGGQAVREASGARVYYHSNDRPELTRQVAAPGLKGWLSEQIPEVGLLVLLKGLLGEAAPRAVEADMLVRDGERIAHDFEVLETPGHTAGHVSYYYHPEETLFAGDALAVVNQKVRFMARPVTKDLDQARASMIRCLSLPIRNLCPGHREPLTDGATQRCIEMLQRLQAGCTWPLLG